MVLAPVGCMGLRGAAPASELAKTGELMAAAARTAAAPAMISRRDTATRRAFEVAFMFMLQKIEKRVKFRNLVTKLASHPRNAIRMCAADKLPTSLRP